MSDDSALLLSKLLEKERDKYGPKLPLDDYFEIYSAEQILKSRGHDLSKDEIESGIMGQGHAKQDESKKGPDGGIDAFYIFANRKLIRDDTDLKTFADQQITIDVVVVQSKNSPGFKEDAIDKMSKFVDLCLRFSAVETTESVTLYKQALRDAVKRFHSLLELVLTGKPSLNIGYYYASLGHQVSAGAGANRDLLIRKTEDAFTIAKVTFDFLGARPLLSLAMKAPETTFTLLTTKDLAMSTAAWVCLVKLGELYKFIDDNGEPRDSIFEANVRDHEGNKAVNNGISATLAAPGNEDFWWLNNGITIIAAKVTAQGPLYSITDPRIVNGLQTSYRIHRHLKVAENQNDARHVLVRLFETNDTASTDRIIRATNSQTNIPVGWLHATDDIQRKIEVSLESVGIFYERRKNYYRNRGKPAKEIITLPYLGQALVALVLQRPDHARARPTTAAEQYYKELFPQNPNYKVYEICARVTRRIDEFLDDVGLERSERLNVFFYVAMYAVCTALKSARLNSKFLSDLDLSLLTDDLLFDCTHEIMNAYPDLAYDDRIAKGPEVSIAMQSALEQKYNAAKP